MHSVSPGKVLTFSVLCQFPAKVKNYHVIFTNLHVKQGYLSGILPCESTVATVLLLYAKVRVQPQLIFASTPSWSQCYPSFGQTWYFLPHSTPSRVEMSDCDSCTYCTCVSLLRLYFVGGWAAVLNFENCGLLNTHSNMKSYDMKQAALQFLNQPPQSICPPNPINPVREIYLCSN